MRSVAGTGTVTGGACPTNPADYVAEPDRDRRLPAGRPDLLARPGQLRRRRQHARDDPDRLPARRPDLRPGDRPSGSPDNTLNGVDTPDTTTPGQLIWSGLTPKSAPGHRDPGHRRTFDAVFASVAAPAATAPPGTIVDNLAKLATTNSAGISSSPRADASYTVGGPGARAAPRACPPGHPRRGADQPGAGPNPPNTDRSTSSPAIRSRSASMSPTPATNPATQGPSGTCCPRISTCADVGAAQRNHDQSGRRILHHRRRGRRCRRRGPASAWPPARRRPSPST